MMSCWSASPEEMLTMAHARIRIAIAAWELEAEELGLSKEHGTHVLAECGRESEFLLIEFRWAA